MMSPRRRVTEVAVSFGKSHSATHVEGEGEREGEREEAIGRGRTKIRRERGKHFYYIWSLNERKRPSRSMWSTFIFLPFVSA
jgi:hypothetical protein